MPGKLYSPLCSKSWKQTEAVNELGPPASFIRTFRLFTNQIPDLPTAFHKSFAQSIPFNINLGLCDFTALRPEPQFRTGTASGLVAPPSTQPDSRAAVRVGVTPAPVQSRMPGRTFRLTLKDFEKMSKAEESGYKTKRHRNGKPSRLARQIRPRAIQETQIAHYNW
jgi:hypothetical protein